MTSSSTAPRIHLERMMHRLSIAVPGDSMASYALIKLVPGAGSSPVVPLHVALALDVSGSMYWDDGTGKSRIDRIRDAALAAVRKLRPVDRLAIIAFANGAKLVLPPTGIGELPKIEEVLKQIDRVDIDQAGTAMHEGIGLALGELAGAGPGFRQAVILTDGETSGENVCKELAEKAAKEQVRFSVMGVGTEWNSGLVKELARLSGGRWYFIDAENPDEAMRVFLAEFDRLADCTFTDVELVVRTVRDVKVKRLRQVGPQIGEIPIGQSEERLFKGSLGTLERTHPVKYLLDLSLPRRPNGKYILAQVEVKYRVGQAEMESTPTSALEMTYTEAGHGYVNAEVARHIDEVQIFELNSDLQQAIRAEDAPEIQRVAAQIVRKGDLLGARAAKKTQLARQILDEISTGGRVNRKTQLAVDDAARQADEFASARIM
jgi:Ca-activated chloride channel family protein